MSGNLEKRGEQCYRIRISRGYDPNTGKRLAPYRQTVHGSRKEAEKILRDLVREIEQTGTIVRTPTITLGHYLEGWMRDVATLTCKPGTLETHGEFIRLYVATDPIHKLLLAQVSTARLQAYYSSLIRLKKLSPSTVRRVHTVLSAALKTAVQQNLLPVNPASQVTLPRLERKPPKRVFSPPEALDFIQALEQDRFGLYFEILLIGGLRPGELAGLLWDAVDFLNGALRVERSLTYLKGGKWVLADTKTAMGRRSIPLPAHLMERLAKHKLLQDQERQLAGKAWKGTEPFVFCSTVGTPVNSHNLKARHLKPILERAGLTPAEFKGLYMMRHSNATLLLSKNASPKIVSERLGHSSTRVTMDVYSHVIEGMQRGATDTLDGLLYPPKA